MKYKVTILGLGYVAWKYDLNNSSKLGLTHLSASKNSSMIHSTFYDSEVLSVKYFSEMTGMAATTNVHDLTDSCDVVVISSDTKSHDFCYDIALELNPKIVLIEKPVADTRDKFNYIHQKSNKSKTPTFVNFQRYADISFTKLSQEIQDKLYGERFEVICWFTGTLLNNGSHMLNLLRKLFGELILPCSLTPHNDSMWFLAAPEISVTLKKVDQPISLFALDIYSDSHKISYDSNSNRILIYNRVKHKRYANEQIYSPRYRKKIKTFEGFSHVYKEIISELESGKSELCVLKDSRWEHENIYFALEDSNV